MTAVASLLIDEYPVMVGDLLLSGPPIPGKRLLPTKGALAPNAVVGSVPKGLRQKISLVADNLVVGWSGIYSTAQDVIQEMRQRAEAQLFNRQLLEEFLQSQLPSVWNDIGLVGHMLDSEGRVVSFGRSANSVTSPAFGRVSLLGSGAEALKKSVLLNSEIPRPAERELNLAQQAVSYGLGLTGRLLLEELHTEESIANFYEGGYELATLSLSKFLKIGDVTYLFWTARYDGKSNVDLDATPYRGFKYSYDGEILNVRSIEFQNDRAENDIVFPIAPAHRYLTEDEVMYPKLADLNSRFLMNYIIVRADLPEPALGLLGLFRNSVEPMWVRFEQKAGEMRIFVEDSFYHRMAQEIVANKDWQAVEDADGQKARGPCASDSA